MGTIIVVLFFITYYFCIQGSYSDRSTQFAFLRFLCVLLVLVITFRGEWPDTDAYLYAFHKAPYLWDFRPDTPVAAYAERGYFLLASISKTIWDNDRFYFFAMAALSMVLLYKNLKAYCVLPLIGLINYMGRFMLNRDFTQMRSSLAILLIVGATKYIHERKPFVYFLIVLLAYQFHHMALLGIPLYFMMYIRWTKSRIVLGLVFAIIISQTAAGFISTYVDAYSTDLNYETYTQDGYAEGSGLRNPMIWFQVVILLLFTYHEDVIRPANKYYDVLRVGYFYSTLFLIIFCNYTALSGRTSTMFATYEMFVVPLLARGFRGNSRWIYLAGVGFVFTYFFAMKLKVVYPLTLL